jgi:hypothetical protein
MKHTATKNKKTITTGIMYLSGIPTCTFPRTGSSGTSTKIKIKQRIINIFNKHVIKNDHPLYLLKL